MLKAIIFDFDGVICESVEAKTAAFRRLFSDYPDQVDKIVSYHKRNGGLSRYEKFKVIFKDFLHKALTEEESERLGRLFSEYSYENVVNAPYVPGVEEFLKKYYKKFLLFIVSGTPEEEMKKIIREKELEKYFKKIYGSPRSKGELVKTILDEYNIKADGAIFVGDSINDQMGAQEAGVRFIGRVHQEENVPFENLNGDSLIENVSDLESKLLL